MIQGKKRTNQRKYLRVPITDEMDRIILKGATEMHLTKGEYCSMKIMDETSGMEEYGRRIMQRMPEFYEHVRNLQSAEERIYFMSFGGALCQYLK